MQEREKAYKAELEMIEKIEKKASAAQEALGSCRMEWGRVQKEMWDSAKKGIDKMARQPITCHNRDRLNILLGITLNFQLRFDVQVRVFLSTGGHLVMQISLTLDERISVRNVPSLRCKGG